MKNGIVHLRWEKDGVVKSQSFPADQSFDHEELTLRPQFRELSGGQLYSLQMEVKSPIRLTDLSVHLTPAVTNVEYVMANGYQTWTQSREMGSHEQIASLRWIGKQKFGPAGDYHFRSSSGKPGQLHSWTYTYLRPKQGQFFLAGSIDESFAFTVFEYQFDQNLLVIEKEVDDLEIQGGSSTPLQLYLGTQEGLEAWDEYAELIQGNHPRLRNRQKVAGWTSRWKNQSEIDEQLIRTNLQALQTAKIPLDLFQIDEGYQEAVGDWLTPNSKFPHGMQKLAEEIREAGLRPGLWLAPFICEEKSTLYQQHPEWLLRDEKGRPVKAGWNSDWNGWLYAVDFYAPGFQDYLRQVFKTMLNDWGYQFLKLDFLYAVAIQSRKDRTRGQIMSEAIAFIRELAGDNWLLGSGVPLGAAFGELDYCQVGSDVAPYWEDAKLAFLNYRERVATVNSLCSTIGRWQLNQRAFMNDPDLFFLRDQGNKLSEVERFTLLLLNNLFGGLISFADEIADYQPEQLAQLRSIYPLVETQVQEVVKTEECYRIRATIRGREYIVYTNLSENACKIDLARSYFTDQSGFIPKGTELELQPHETICLHQYQVPEKEPYLLGAKGHLFAGAQIVDLEINGEEVTVQLAPEASDETKVYLGVPYQYTNLKINGKYYSVKLAKTGLRYVSVSKDQLV